MPLILPVYFVDFRMRNIPVQQPQFVFQNDRIKNITTTDPLYNYYQVLYICENAYRIHYLQNQQQEEEFFHVPSTISTNSNLDFGLASLKRSSTDDFTIKVDLDNTIPKSQLHSVIKRFVCFMHVRKIEYKDVNDEEFIEGLISQLHKA